MHFAQPYGHLVVNGNPVTETQLGLLTGTPQDQISALLAELENSGVLSKTRAGVIYSRRMTRDAKKAADAKKNGRLGGNPNLTKSEGVNPPDNIPLAPKGQRPESRKKDSQEILGGLASSLQGRSSTWTPEQKKAAWQGKIIQFAQQTLPEREYLHFYEGLLNSEEWADKMANELDRKRKARVA